MNYQQKINDLKRYVKMQSEDDIKLFDLGVYELADTKDPEVLEQLIDLFDDECEFPEVMYSLVHAIESYPAEMYVKGILRKVKDYTKYHEWFSSLFCHILNSYAYLDVLKQNLHLANKEQLFELFNIIYEESETHRLIIEELRNKLESI